MIARRLCIRGHVQGVYYRESMRQQARAVGVTGWVRNRADGSVEAVVQGDHMAVERMIDWARRGPPAARVDEVRIEEADDEPPCAAFEKRSTV
ncbi:MAG TPA: acylphosphatase [Burkholderiales bacterium]